MNEDKIKLKTIYKKLRKSVVQETHAKQADTLKRK